MITAIVNLQRQHLCGLVFSKWHFTEIVQALTSAVFYFCFLFYFYCSLLFLFLPTYPLFFLFSSPPFPNTFSFPISHPSDLCSISFSCVHSFLPPLSLLLVISLYFLYFTSLLSFLFSYFSLLSSSSYLPPPILPHEKFPLDLNVPKAYSHTPLQQRTPRFAQKILIDVSDK